MNTIPLHTQIVCFGETLFDVLPDGAVPGGAPMNVGIHLKYNGHSPLVISRVGQDNWGNTLLDFLEQKGLSTAYIQRDRTQQTGIVEANVSNKTQVTYTIVQPVAWDFIEYDAQVEALISTSALFVYGSLASRSQTTRDTLLRYLPMAPTTVFDVNLRPPHYSPEIIKQLMEQADIVKMNHHELLEIAGWYGQDQSMDERQSIQYLFEKLGKQILIVTRGENGAACITKDGYFEHPGFQVSVVDTIGSGDAFLAAFLHQYLNNRSPETILPYACAAGAYVATQRGATPRMPENFMDSLR